MKSPALAVACLVLFSACPDPPIENSDSGQVLRYDAGLTFDAMVVDAGVADRGLRDQGRPDLWAPDTGFPDTARDASLADLAGPDTWRGDASLSDQISADGWRADAAAPADSGLADAAAASTSEQIAATLAATPGTVDQPIDRAVITYLRPVVGDDPEGMYLQAELNGPALFVAFAPTAPNPAPVTGDVVSLRVTGLTVDSGHFAYASAYDSYVRHRSGFNVANLRQDLSTASDLVSSLPAYVGERMAMNLTIRDVFGFAGAGHQSAMVDSDAILDDTGLKLRLPDAVVAALQARLRVGCRLRVDGVMHRYLQQAQPSAWREADLQSLSCPGPSLLQAGAASQTEIVLLFDQDISPASALPAAFAVTPSRSVNSVSVSANQVSLLVAPLASGQSYRVAVAGSLESVLGDPIVAGSDSATVLWQALSLVINEVDYDQPGIDTLEYVEIKNTGSRNVDLAAAGVDLVFYNGSTSNPGVYRRAPLDDAGSLAPGGYLVVASDNVTVAGAGPVLRFVKIDGTLSLRNNVQNATDGPDGLALYHRWSASLLDALSYDGAITAADIDAQSFNLVEGSPAPVTDSGSVERSLCRLPDGSDSDDAATDWAVCSTLTPGSGNLP